MEPGDPNNNNGSDDGNGNGNDITPTEPRSSSSTPGEQQQQQQQQQHQPRTVAAVRQEKDRARVSNFSITGIPGSVGRITPVLPPSTTMRRSITTPAATNAAADPPSQPAPLLSSPVETQAQQEVFLDEDQELDAGGVDVYDGSSNTRRLSLDEEKAHANAIIRLTSTDNNRGGVLGSEEEDTSDEMIAAVAGGMTTSDDIRPTTLPRRGVPSAPQPPMHADEDDEEQPRRRSGGVRRGPNSEGDQQQQEVPLQRSTTAPTRTVMSSLLQPAMTLDDEKARARAIMRLTATRKDQLDSKDNLLGDDDDDDEDQQQQEGHMVDADNHGAGRRNSDNIFTPPTNMATSDSGQLVRAAPEGQKTGAALTTMEVTGDGTPENDRLQPQQDLAAAKHRAMGGSSRQQLVTRVQPSYRHSGSGGSDSTSNFMSEKQRISRGNSGSVRISGSQQQLQQAGSVRVTGNQQQLHQTRQQREQNKFASQHSVRGPHMDDYDGASSHVQLPDMPEHLTQSDSGAVLRSMDSLPSFGANNTSNNDDDDDDDDEEHRRRQQNQNQRQTSAGSSTNVSQISSVSLEGGQRSDPLEKFHGSITGQSLDVMIPEDAELRLEDLEDKIGVQIVGHSHDQHTNYSGHDSAGHNSFKDAAWGFGSSHTPTNTTPPLRGAGRNALDGNNMGLNDGGGAMDPNGMYIDGGNDGAAPNVQERLNMRIQEVEEVLSDLRQREQQQQQLQELASQPQVSASDAGGGGGTVDSVVAGIAVAQPVQEDAVEEDVVEAAHVEIEDDPDANRREVVQITNQERSRYKRVKIATYVCIVVVAIVVGVLAGGFIAGGGGGGGGTPAPEPPKQCFLGLEELQIAVDVLITTEESELAQTFADYGWPIDLWCVSLVTDFTKLFSGLRNEKTSFLNYDIRSWDMSNATSLSYMFSGMTGPLVPNQAPVYSGAFNQPLDTWDTRLVTDTSYMFNGATSFNQDISTFNMSSVLGMEFMFAHAAVFDQELNTWDTSNVVDLRGIFSGAVSFNQDLDQWDTSKADSMIFMFSSAVSFNGDISTWDTGKVEDMSNMFFNATSFAGEGISAWNTARVANMEKMFESATSFQNDDIGTWDVSSVVNMRRMFYKAENFNADISTWNVSSVQKFGGMFASALNFDQDLCEWGASIDPNAVVESMFSRTSCETKSDPDLTADPPGPFCRPCA